MKLRSWKNYDDEVTAYALRWRRPKVLAAMIVAVVAAMLCALLAIAIGKVALILSALCMVVAMVYAVRLSRLERKLQEIER